MQALGRGRLRAWVVGPAPLLAVPPGDLAGLVRAQEFGVPTGAETRGGRDLTDGQTLTHGLRRRPRYALAGPLPGVPSSVWGSDPGMGPHCPDRRYIPRYGRTPEQYYPRYGTGPLGPGIRFPASPGFKDESDPDQRHDLGQIALTG